MENVGLLSLQNEKNILWDIYVGHPIFSIGVVDITGNGKKEIVAACWDGMIFICDIDRNVISFQCLDNSICAFAAGNIIKNGKSVAMLAFATLSKNLFIYSDLNITSLHCTPLMSTLKPKFSESPIAKGVVEDKNDILFFINYEFV